MEKTLKQYETEYNQKADELDETLILVEKKDQAYSELESKLVVC